MKETLRPGFKALRDRVQSKLKDYRDRLLNSSDTLPPFPNTYPPKVVTSHDNYFTCNRTDARGCNRIRFYLENDRVIRVQHCYAEHTRMTEYVSISPDGTVLIGSAGEDTNVDEILHDFLTAELI